MSVRAPYEFKMTQEFLAMYDEPIDTEDFDFEDSDESDYYILQEYSGADFLTDFLVYEAGVQGRDSPCRREKMDRCLWHMIQMKFTPNARKRKQKKLKEKLQKENCYVRLVTYEDESVVSFLNREVECYFGFWDYRFGWTHIVDDETSMVKDHQSQMGDSQITSIIQFGSKQDRVNAEDELTQQSFKKWADMRLNIRNSMISKFNKKLAKQTKTLTRANNLIVGRKRYKISSDDCDDNDDDDDKNDEEQEDNDDENEDNDDDEDNFDKEHPNRVTTGNKRRRRNLAEKETGTRSSARLAAKVKKEKIENSPTSDVAVSTRKQHGGSSGSSDSSTVSDDEQHVYDSSKADCLPRGPSKSGKTGKGSKSNKSKSKSKSSKRGKKSTKSKDSKSKSVKSNKKKSTRKSKSSTSKNRQTKNNSGDSDSDFGDQARKQRGLSAKQIKDQEKQEKLAQEDEKTNVWIATMRALEKIEEEDEKELKSENQIKIRVVTLPDAFMPLSDDNIPPGAIDSLRRGKGRYYGVSPKEMMVQHEYMSWHLNLNLGEHRTILTMAPSRGRSDLVAWGLHANRHQSLRWGLINEIDETEHWVPFDESERQFMYTYHTKQKLPVSTGDQQDEKQQQRKKKNKPNKTTKYIATFTPLTAGIRLQMMLVHGEEGRVCRLITQMMYELSVFGKGTTLKSCLSIVNNDQMNYHTRVWYAITMYHSYLAEKLFIVNNLESGKIDPETLEISNQKKWKTTPTVATNIMQHFGCRTHKG